jgi:hypothetical protein
MIEVLGWLAGMAVALAIVLGFSLPWHTGVGVGFVCAALGVLAGQAIGDRL